MTPSIIHGRKRQEMRQWFLIFALSILAFSDGGHIMGFRDMDLDDQVRGALRKNRELSSFRIEVNVRNGIVHLGGDVTPDAHDQVIQIARGVENIAVVVDDMSVVT